LLKSRHDKIVDLHAKYLNPKDTNVVTTLGFDRFYDRGEGCYPYYDAAKRPPLVLNGVGVFALGRRNPVVKDARRQIVDADPPNMGPDGPCPCYPACSPNNR
jgi:ornithine--oxo-acid transaminase